MGKGRQNALRPPFIRVIRSSAGPVLVIMVPARRAAGPRPSGVAACWGCRLHEVRLGVIWLVVDELVAGGAVPGGDGAELTERAAGHASWSTMAVLRRLGALTDDGPRHRATKLTRDCMTFARAALYSWPQR